MNPQIDKCDKCGQMKAGCHSGKMNGYLWSCFDCQQEYFESLEKKNVKLKESKNG